MALTEETILSTYAEERKFLNNLEDPPNILEIKETFLSLMEINSFFQLFNILTIKLLNTWVCIVISKNYKFLLEVYIILLVENIIKKSLNLVNNTMFDLLKNRLGIVSLKVIANYYNFLFLTLKFFNLQKPCVTYIVKEKKSKEEGTIFLYL